MIRDAFHTRVNTSGDRQEVENQKAGLRRPAGRPRIYLDGARIVALRDGAQLSWRAIAKQLRAGATTVRRAYRDATRSGSAAGQNPESGRSTAEGSTEEESA
jgi:DNA invertase Pin-like site-specific DNA recombinase